MLVLEVQALYRTFFIFKRMPELGDLSLEFDEFQEGVKSRLRDMARAYEVQAKFNEDRANFLNMAANCIPFGNIKGPRRHGKMFTAWLKAREEQSHERDHVSLTKPVRSSQKQDATSGSEGSSSKVTSQASQEIELGAVPLFGLEPTPTLSPDETSRRRMSRKRKVQKMIYDEHERHPPRKSARRRRHKKPRKVSVSSISD